MQRKTAPIRRTPVRRGAKSERRARRQFVQFMACGAAFVLLVALKLFTPEHAITLRRTISGAMERNFDVQEVFSSVGRAFTDEGGAGEGLREVWRAVFQPEALPASDTTDSVPVSDTANSGADGVTVSSTADSGAESGTTNGVSSSGADSVPVSDVSNGVAVSDTAAGVLTPYHWSGSFGNSTAFTSLSEPWPDAPAVSEPAPASISEPASDASAAEDGQALLYNGLPLPENVAMEQTILNFDYLTPVQGTLTSTFGYRNHPIDGVQRFHYGVDLAASSGTEIVSFADGVVTAVGESTSFGKYCTVEHGGGFTTLYAHCSRVTASAGAAVRMGDKLAEVGETGQATGPHLHFALQRDGVYLNPVYYVVD